jgi:hypothetical protein
MMVGEVQMGDRRVKDNTYKKAIVIHFGYPALPSLVFGGHDRTLLRKPRCCAIAPHDLV